MRPRNLARLLCPAVYLFMVLPFAAEPADAPIEISPKASRIHKKAIVIDGHNDLPWELRSNANSSFDQADLAGPLPQFHTDIPRLRKGGVGAQFWVAYVPAETAAKNLAAHLTLEQIDLIHRMIARYPETFAFARSAEDIERIHRRGKIASLIGVEGGHSIENSLAILRLYHQLGVSYLTLTHSDSLDWADSATDAPKAHGLSAFGREVVREMNRLGMLVDISHVSAQTMHAVLDISKAPIIASHSSAFAIAPTPRNIPDDVLARIKTNGGIVMVNFFSGFVVPEGASIATESFAIRRKLLAEHPDEASFRKALRQWRDAHPVPRGTVRDLVDHIDHVVKIAGIDHVGLGSDYDGVGVLPAELPDVSSYPVITQELLNRGYSESRIKKVLGKNLLRVLRAAEKVAARERGRPPATSPSSPR